VGSTAAAGTYPITITGTGGGSTHNTTVNLTVTTAVTSGWSAGFDFRSSPTYVTDPANTTYVSGDTYPTTRAGYTFGWISTSGLLTRDRSSSIDPRLAGIQAVPNNTTPLTFEIDVPSPGTYMVALAMGDAGSDQYDNKVAFLDGSTPLFSVSATAIAPNSYLDATGVVRTAAQWPAANAMRQVTLTGTKLMVSVGSNLGTGDYTPIAFVGVSQVGGGSQTPDFTISAAPTAVSAAQGASNTSIITTTALNGFNAAVNLSASGAPAGVTVSFNPASIAAPGNGGSTVTFTVGSTAATGTYPIAITGTSGGITHNATVNLTVTAASDFTISAAPTAVSVAPGAAGTSTITTTALNGFNSAITLSASGAPAGVTVSFNPAQIAAPGNGSSTATFTVGSTAAAGTYPISITGTGGSLTHSTTVNLTVTSGTSSGWSAGFDFRATQDFVADPAGDNFALGGSTLYPTARNGVTFGWTSAVASSRDRSATVDQRLAGINFVTGNVAPGVFQIDLPGPGTYKISLAMGDAGSAQYDNKIEFKDGSTSLFVVQAPFLPASQFADANGTIWTSAQWPVSNTTRQVTVTGSSLTIYVGANDGSGSPTTLAFVGVSQ
jgi:hypothetical protein